MPLASLLIQEVKTPLAVTPPISKDISVVSTPSLEVAPIHSLRVGSGAFADTSEVSTWRTLSPALGNLDTYPSTSITRPGNHEIRQGKPSAELSRWLRCSIPSLYPWRTSPKSNTRRSDGPSSGSVRWWPVVVSLSVLG